jgi:hypothetical protein
MVDVTLIVGGTTFTFSNGDVQKITSTIETSAEQQKIASVSALGTRIYDYDGVIKMITISGVLTEAATTRISGHTITTIFQQKSWLESLANAAQGSITFQSNYESSSAISSTGAVAPYKAGFGNTTCKIMGMRFEEEEGVPNKLPFTITLGVGV